MGVAALVAASSSCLMNIGFLDRSWSILKGQGNNNFCQMKLVVYAKIVPLALQYVCPILLDYTMNNLRACVV